MSKYLKQRLGAYIVVLICAGLFLLIFYLYNLPMKAIAYPCMLCLSIFVVYEIFLFLKEKRKHEDIKELAAIPDNMAEVFKHYEDILDCDYQEIIRALQSRLADNETAYRDRTADSNDYYTTWVHQIKTPIASMRLRLENEDSELSSNISGDLFRIEQYVEMVLTYQRLSSESTDYVFKEYELDKIVKGAVRKYAGVFIRKNIKLEYGRIDIKVVTDEKWLSFVIEQLLSNALKYTPAGSVEISATKAGALCIRDTGIGINPEDIPRIFDRGYTGSNGRMDKRASGLGLYLCKKICDKMGVGIMVESKPGEGTKVSLLFDMNNPIHE